MIGIDVKWFGPFQFSYRGLGGCQHAPRLGTNNCMLAKRLVPDWDNLNPLRCNLHAGSKL
jgi:hypothetical protein